MNTLDTSHVQDILSNDTKPTANVFNHSTQTSTHATLPARYILSIDIETLDTKPTAKVLSIGACVIDIYTLRIMAHFEVVIDPFCYYQNAARRTVSPSTVKWWRTRDADDSRFPSNAAYEFTHNGILNTLESLDLLITWLNTYYTPIKKECIINARGPEFDLVILEHLANSVNKRLPLMFSTYDSNRTTERYAMMMGIAPTTKEELRHILPFDSQIKHTARYDSAWEGIDAAKSYHAMWWLCNHGRVTMRKIVNDWLDNKYTVINDDEL